MPLHDPIQELFSNKLKDHASEVPGHVWSGVAQSLAPRVWWKSWWTAAGGAAAIAAAVTVGVLSNHTSPAPQVAPVSIESTAPSVDSAAAHIVVTPPPPPPLEGEVIEKSTVCCLGTTEPLVEIPVALPSTTTTSSNTPAAEPAAATNSAGNQAAATEETPASAPATHRSSEAEKAVKINRTVIDANQLLFYFFPSDEGTGTWQWDFGDGTTAEGKDVMHTYEEEGTYTVTLRKWNASGSPEKSLTLTTEAYRPVKLNLPTVFTPNEDGRNDVFSIGEESTGVKTVLDILIRTRDGQEVARTQGAPWDGKWPNGEEAAAGVYLYTIRIAGTNGKISEQSGTVQLLR